MFGILVVVGLAGVVGAGGAGGGGGGAAVGGGGGAGVVVVFVDVTSFCSSIITVGGLQSFSNTQTPSKFITKPDLHKHVSTIAFLSLQSSPSGSWHVFGHDLAANSWLGPQFGAFKNFI